MTDVPPLPLTYVPHTTTVDGSPVADVGGQSPLSHGLAGFRHEHRDGRAGASVTISYTAGARAVADTGSLRFAGTVSSREQVEPIPANAPAAPTLAQLQTLVARIPGVAAADPRLRRPCARFARGRHVHAHPTRCGSSPSTRASSRITPRSGWSPEASARFGPPERRGGPGPRRGPRRHGRAAHPGPARGALAARERGGRPDPRAAVVREPEVHEARGVPLRARLDRGHPRDVPRRSSRRSGGPRPRPGA